MEKKYPAWQLEYSEIIEDERMTHLDVFTKVNDTLYRLMYSPGRSEAYGRNLPEVRNVIDSMIFTSIQEPVIKTPSFMNNTEESPEIASKKLESNTTEAALDEALKLLESNATLDEALKLFESCVGKSFAECEGIPNRGNNALQIVSDNSFTDSIGYLHVVGEVKNDSPSTAEFVKVIATFYDVNKKVAATDSAYTDPSTIPAGNTAPFELILTSASIPVEKIDSYKLDLSYK